MLGSVQATGGGIAGAIDKLNSQFKYLVSSAECKCTINYDFMDGKIYTKCNSSSYNSRNLQYNTTVAKCNAVLILEPFTEPKNAKILTF